MSYNTNRHGGDVIGAMTALDAARIFMGRLKREGVKRIDKNRTTHVREVDMGRCSGSFDKSDFECKLSLPKSITVVPMKDIDGYHDFISLHAMTRSIAPWSAFTSLWNWDKKAEVML